MRAAATYRIKNDVDGAEYMTGLPPMQGGCREARLGEKAVWLDPVTRGYWPKWESAYRTGALETLITPSNGLSISRIRKTTLETDNAHRKMTATTVAFRGAKRPKLMKVMVSQSASATRKGTWIVAPVPPNISHRDFSRPSVMSRARRCNHHWASVCGERARIRSAIPSTSSATVDGSILSALDPSAGQISSILIATTRRIESRISFVSGP